jgi:hypothetical protein
MLSMPRSWLENASGVGTQMWNVLLKRRRKSFVGAQWSGNAAWKAEASSHCMANGVRSEAGRPGFLCQPVRQQVAVSAPSSVLQLPPHSQHELGNKDLVFWFFFCKRCCFQPRRYSQRAKASAGMFFCSSWPRRRQGNSIELQYIGCRQAIWYGRTG